MESGNEGNYYLIRFHLGWYLWACFRRLKFFYVELIISIFFQIVFQLFTVVYTSVFDYGFSGPRLSDMFFAFLFFNYRFARSIITRGILMLFFSSPVFLASYAD